MARNIILLALILGIAGCMAPESHVKKADEAASGIITEYQKKALDKTEPFTIEEPADSLRRRLMIDQTLPGHISNVTSNELFISGKPLKITLVDALQIAARNNRSYQETKESIFSTALDLDLQRAEYRNSYSGMLSTLFSGSGSGDDASRSSDSEASAGITRKLQTGASLSGKIGLDLVKLLTSDKTSTFGIFADASVSIPLLAGAGKDIVRESLTQAERNVIYAMWSFEQYKKTFAISVADSYLSTIEIKKQMENAESNYESIVAARKRLQSLAEAGRASRTDLDQAKQNELQADNTLVAARQSLQSQMDSLKITLGIPTDAKIELEDAELVKVSEETMNRLEKEKSLTAAEAEKQACEYVLTALSNRLDLMTVKNRHEDVLRQLKISADSLDPEMTLALSASTRRTDISGGSGDSSDSEVDFSDGSYSAQLELDLPWDKTDERIAYRKSLISLRKAERSIEEKEDSIKQEIRSAARNIIRLRETCLIQQQSVKVAASRVEREDLLFQAGEGTTRDLLEAREDLVAAQNSLVSAMVDYHIATLELQKALELLEVNEKGLWQRNE